MIKAVIFDVDNTLVDFMKMKRLAVEAAISSMIDAGLQVTISEANKTIDQIYKDKGIEYQKVFDLFLETHLQKMDYRIWSAGVVAYRRSREASLIPYPHVHSTIHQLMKKGIKMGVLSDAPSREVWLRLAYMNFHHLFDVVVTSEDTGKFKPNPDGFELVLKRLEVSPAEAIMVGDWVERDIAGAKGIGMKTAFAKYGDTFNNQATIADYELDDISKLIDIINSENS